MSWRRQAAGALVIHLLVAAAGWAQATSTTPEARFTEGLAAYESGDFRQASDIWQGLLDEGYGGVELVYNLGNAWYRLGDAGRAVLNWERALQQDPLDRDARANLDIIRPGLADQFDAPVRLPVWDWLDGLLARLPSGPLAWVSLLFALGTATVISFRYLAPERRLPAAARLLLAVLSAPALTGMLLLLLQDRRLAHRPLAVLLSPKIEVRAAPSQGAMAQFDLHAGTAVVQMRMSGDGWSEIGTPDGRSGWVPPGSLEAVRLGMPAQP